MKILIAEDSPTWWRLIKKTLEDAGYEVLIAEDGKKAWAIIQKENVKLIIVDWLMSGLDGIELCRKVRTSQTQGYVYIIFLTSKDKKDDMIAGLDAGADDYMVKPFEKAELLVRIRGGERVVNLEKELMGKNAKLEELVSIDPLMEIYNRRSFYEAIERAHDRARRYEQVYGIIICDIDYFKSYNDTY